MQALWRWTGLAAALALAACGGCHGDGDSGDSPPAQVPQVTLKTERVFPNLSFTMPVAMLQAAPGNTLRWFVVEQGGVVWMSDATNNNVTQAQRTVFIDISARVSARGELGLLGMAFHPQFPATRRVFLFYSHTDPTMGLVSRLSEFTSAVDGLSLDPNSERILMTIPKPNAEENHNGGNLAFGPDSLLYIGTGDGGGGNDQHGTIGNAQSTNTVLGKILRINVAPATSYAIPPSNPFAGNTLCSTDNPAARPQAQPCPEIFALGFRNPFRWSFDRGTTQLWVGDVGQGALEEVDRVDLGMNYGWRCFEGSQNTGLGCGTPGPTQFPVAQYGRTVGTTVIGGYVYRGSRLPGLVGRYIFGDFGSGRIFNIDATAQPVLQITTGFESGLQISSFAEDVNGELFVVNYAGNLHRITQ